MSPHSRRDALRIGAVTVALPLVGCNDTPGGDGFISPENPHSDAPHSAPDELGSPTDTGSSTRTPDCTVTDIILDNDVPQPISVSFRIIREYGDERRRSPTPSEVFSDSVRLPGNGQKKYQDVPDVEGRYRLKVAVEDGPRRTRRDRGNDWGGSRWIIVEIKADSIRFIRDHADPPTGC